MIYGNVKRDVLDVAEDVGEKYRAHILACQKIIDDHPNDYSNIVMLDGMQVQNSMEAHEKYLIDHAELMNRLKNFMRNL